MKTILSTLALIATTTIFGQNVTLNVKLHSIQSLTINPSQTEVNLNYHTKQDYEDGVSNLQSDHLEIYSTGGFKIQVVSSDLINPEENIEVGTISLVASNGNNGLPDADFTTTVLSSSATTIISSNVGGVDKTFNVEYKGGGGNQYVNKYHSGEEPTIYTTTVTYTISPL